MTHDQKGRALAGAGTIIAILVFVFVTGALTYITNLKDDLTRCQDAAIAGDYYREQYGRKMAQRYKRGD